MKTLKTYLTTNAIIWVFNNGDKVMKRGKEYYIAINDINNRFYHWQQVKGYIDVNSSNVLYTIHN